MSDAKITVSADASAVERAAAAAKMAWRDAGSAIRDAIGSTARAVAGDFAQVALATGKISFSSQHQSVRDFESATARLSVSSGRDLASLRNEFEGVGQAIGKRPGEVAAWVTEVGNLSYSFDGAKDSAAAMAGLAAQTGRSFDSFRGLAVQLGQAKVAGGDTAEVIGVMAAQAERLGTIGGVAALTDQLQAAGAAVTMFADGGAKGIERMTGLLAELGKGLNPVAAQRVQSNALGSLASDPLRWERYLGRQITDEHGQIADPTKVLRDIAEKTKRRYGKDSRRVLELNFGAETGAALSSANFDEAASLAGLKPSTAPKDAQKKLNATDSGQLAVASSKLEASSRDLLGSSSRLGQAANAMERLASDHPVLSTIGTTFAGTALSNFMAKFDRSVAGSFSAGTVQRVVGVAKMGAGEGIAAIAGGAGSAIKGLGAAAIAAAGPMLTAAGAAAVLGAGLYAVQKFEEVTEDRHKAEEKERDVASDGGRRLKHIAIERTNRAMHDLEGLKGRDRADAINAMARIMVSKDPTAALAISHGGEVAQKTTAAELEKSGRSHADAEIIARAVAEAISRANIKATVVNATGGPVEVTTQGAHSAAAGSQSGG